MSIIILALALPAFSAQRLQRIDGSSITAAEADAAITRLMAAAKVMGLSVAILNDDRVVYLRSFGLANVEKQQPLRTDSIVWAASFTKAVFGWFVMQLVEEGKIDLDTTIDHYLPKPLPEYEKYADLANDERWRQLTPRILLSHTSGFANYRFLEPDEKLHIHFAPGSRFAYSGEGINLLQFVIEAKLGKPVAELMAERIFRPSGMSRTSMTWQPQFADDIALGYDEQGKVLGHRQRSSRAAGSMDTTIADMAKFVEAVMQGRGLGAKARAELFRPQIEILSKSQFPTLRPDLTDENHPIRLSYALGWGTFVSPYGRAVFKEGHDDGWENHMVLFPSRKIALVLMANSSNSDSIYKELLETLIGDRWTPWRWEGYTPYAP